MRQALAVSRDGRDPQTFVPWARETRTRSFAEFEKNNPFMFGKRKAS